MPSRVRLLCQSAFLALSLSVFFGLAADRRLIQAYHSLHLFPALSQPFWLALPPLAGVTVLLILLTVVFGRLYCSYLCPVGFLQDLSRGLGRRLGCAGGPAAGRAGPRFAVLGACLAFLVLKSSAYLYFDHFSSLGRVYGLAHAAAAGGPFGGNFCLGLLFLAVITLVPLRWPRWFCGALCPSGTLFMLLQSMGRAAGRLVRAKARPAEPAPGPGNRDRVPGLSRRGLLAAAGSFLAGGAAGFLFKRRWLRGGPARAVVPPGGKSGESFLERCSACDACVSVCPTKVLVPAGRELGLPGLAKARLDFGSGYCAYECNACLAVCPTGAISYFPLETKKRIRIGKSRLIKDLCIPFAFERDCGACQEQCPTGAIVMEPFRGVFAPVQRPDFCIGCGSCQFACPTRPRKAIVVDPEETHTFAEAPRGGGPRRRGPAGPAPAPFPF